MQYISSIIIAALLVLVIALIIRSIRKAKKSGQSWACSCSCSGCAMSGMCHNKKEE